MLKSIIIAATAATIITSSANAFNLFGIEFSTPAPVVEESFGTTIPSGSVLTSDGTVAEAHTTPTGSAILADQGYLITAGNLYVQAGDHTTTISLHDVRSASNVKEYVVSRVKADVIANGLSIEQVTDIANAEGFVDLEGKTKDEIVSLISENIDSIVASGEISSSIVDAIGEEAVSDALGAAESAANGVDTSANQEGWASLSDSDFQAAVDAGNIAGMTSDGQISDGNGNFN